MMTLVMILIQPQDPYSLLLHNPLSMTTPREMFLRSKQRLKNTWTTEQKFKQPSMRMKELETHMWCTITNPLITRVNG